MDSATSSKEFWTEEEAAPPSNINIVYVRYCRDPGGIEGKGSEWKTPMSQPLLVYRKLNKVVSSWNMNELRTQHLANEEPSRDFEDFENRSSDNDEPEELLI